MSFKYIDAHGIDTARAYKLLVGCVVPRPIAWVTTLNATGLVNAAPFSAYNYLATDPPMLGISIASREGELKDTASNIVLQKEFVVNVTDEDHLDLMHQSAFEFPSGVSETERLGIELIESKHVKTPRIASTPIQMECRLDQYIPLGTGRCVLYVGEILAFHLREDLYDGERVNTEALKPMARMGGPFYGVIGEMINKPMLQKPPGAEGWSGSGHES